MPSNATDTRVVQMQFDNSSFERDISQSEKSLERFKEALDFSKAEKSLDEFSDSTKKLTFESMAENIQKLADKFTGLGTVSEFVLGQIRQGFEKAAYQAKSFIDSLTTQQISVGMDKFGQLNKNVQTIKAATGKSEEDVYRVLSRLNTYTDQTSYNFTDMAANIGKFTSVGIDLESAEKQMEGIANWAARSGGGINEASRAMYNLSQAMGVGALTKMDWKSIENAGMATKEFKEQLIQAGVASGNLEKTVGKNGEATYKTAKKFGKQTEVTYQNLAETLSKKWVDTTVMQKTFLGYYFDDLYYEREDVLKKALDDGTVSKSDWGDFKSKNVATEEFKQNVMDAAVEVGNLTKETTKDGKTIYKTAKKYGDQIEVTLDNFEQSLDKGWFDKGVKKQTDALSDLAESSYESAQKCTTLTDVFEAWKDQISTGWMTSFKHIFGELTESMELFSNICNKVGSAFDELIQYRNKILEFWSGTGGRNNLWSLIVGEVVDEGEVVAYEGAYGFLDILGDIGKLISTGFHNLIKMIAGKDVAKLIEKNGDEWEQAFISFKINKIITSIRDFIKSIHDFFNATAKGSDKSRWDQIQDVVDAIYASFLLAYTVIRDVAEFFGELFDEKHLGQSVDSILRVFDALGLGITKTAESAKEGSGLKVLLDNILISIEPLIAAVNQLVESLSASFIAFIQNGTEAGTFTGIWQTIVDIISLLGRIFSKVGVPILNFIKTFLEIVVDLFEGEFTTEKFTTLTKRLGDAVGQLINDLFGLIPGFGKDIQSFIAYLFGFAEDYTGEEADASSNTIIGVLGKWAQKIFGIGSNVVEEIGKDAEKFNLFTWIKSVLGMDAFSGFLGQTSDMIKGTNLYGIIMAFLGGNALLQLIKIIKQGREIFGGVGEFFEGASETLKEGLKIKVGEETEGFVDKFSAIAKSIVMIAAAIAVLGSMSIPSLLTGLGVIAVALLGVFGFIKLLETQIKSEPKKLKGLIGMIASAAALIFGISIGFAVLIAAIRPMASMNIEQIVTMLTGFLGVVLIVGLFAKYMSDTMKNMNTKGILSVGVLGIAIGILINSLMPLTNLSQEQLLKMAEGLVGALLILALFAQYANNFEFKGVLSVAGLAISIGILIMALMPLTNLSNDQLLKMAEGLTGALLILALFAQYANNFKFKGIFSVIALAASIAILVFALQPLADYSWEQLGKMGAGLAVIMLILGTFVNETASMKGTGMLNVVFVAAAIWLLVRALEPLANYEWEQLGKMAAGLIFVILMIKVLTNNVGNMNIAQGVSSMLMMVGLAVVIGVFGLTMGLLSGLSWDQMITACLGLVGIIVAFGLIQKHMLSNSDILDSVHSLILMAGLAVLMVAFSLALNEIKDIPLDKVLGFSLGLAALIIALGGALKLLDGVGLVSGIKGIALISVGIAAFLGVLSLMLPVLMGSIGGALITMASRMEIAGKMLNGLVSTLSSLNGSAIDDSGIKVDKIFAIIKKFEGSSKYLKPIDDFEKCAGKLGTAVNTFQTATKNVTDPDTMYATKLIDKLLEYANKIVPIANYKEFVTSVVYLGAGISVFSNESANVSVENASNVCAVVDMLLKYTSFEDVFIGSSDFINDVSYFSGGLSTFMTNVSGIVYANAADAFSLIDKLLTYTDFSGVFKGSYGFAYSISSFGGGLTTFMSNVSGIVYANAADAFSLIDKLLTYTSFEDVFKGSTLFSNRISYVGGGLSSFMTNASSITDGNPPALQFLTNMANNANNINTLATIKLDGFADQMSALGGGLSIYALGVKEANGIEIGDIPDVSGAINILTSLVEGLKMEGIKEEDFKLPELPEDSNFTTFGTQLAALAGGLIKFAEASDSLKSFNKARQVLSFLNNLRNNLTTDNVNTTKIFTDTGTTSDTLTQFGTDISALGGSLKSYSENTKDFVKNEGALNVLDFMYELKEKLNGNGRTFDGDMFKTISSTGLDDTALTKFGTDMAALGGSMKTYSDSTQDFKKNEAALSALDFMYDLKDKLSREDKTFDWDIFGIFTSHSLDDTALTKFGNDMSALGGSLKKYSDDTKDFVANEGALNALDFLYDLKEKLSSSGERQFDWDVFNLFTQHELDDEALTKFGNDIAALGGSMGTYYEATKDFKFSEKEGPFGALTFFDELQTKLQNKSIKKDILEGFFGTLEEGDLASFGQQIGELGTYLAGFASSVTVADGDEIKEVNFDNAISAVSALRDIALTLPVIGGLEGWLHGDNESLEQFGNDINTLGTSLALFSEKLSGNSDVSKVPYNAELVISALEALSIIADLAVLMGQKLGETAIFEGYDYSEAFASMVSCLSGLQEMPFSQSWIDNMVAFMKKFEDAALAAGGFKDATIFTAFSNMAKGLEKLTIAGTQTNFQDVGKSIIEGIAVGIENNQSRAIDALVTAALAAYEAGKKAIDSNSPSKLFATLGESMSSGVAVGIENNADQAAEAGEQMATDTFGFTSSVASMLEHLLNDDSDFNPTITPVLDLSKVTEGAGQIDSLLGNDHSITIDASSSSAAADWAIPYLSSISANQNKIDLTGIQNQITNLQTAINNVNTTVGNLKIYLNSNVIAGAVTDDVDRGIGRNMLYASRNN